MFLKIRAHLGLINPSYATDLIYFIFYFVLYIIIGNLNVFLNTNEKCYRKSFIKFIIGVDYSNYNLPFPMNDLKEKKKSVGFVFNAGRRNGFISATSYFIINYYRYSESF